jgi:hypothetical protein
MSSYARITEFMDSLERPLDDQLQRLQNELIRLIESRRHIILGAKATMFYTKPRYTADVDYAVGSHDFAAVRAWFSQTGVEHEFNGEAIQCERLRVDVIDASKNPVIAGVLSRETGIPSVEAVAALKYASAISPTRAYERRRQDAADFAALVRRAGFGADKFLGFFTGAFEAERENARTVLADVQAGRPCSL